MLVNWNHIKKQLTPGKVYLCLDTVQVLDLYESTPYVEFELRVNDTFIVTNRPKKIVKTRDSILGKRISHTDYYVPILGVNKECVGYIVYDYNSKNKFMLYWDASKAMASA